MIEPSKVINFDAIRLKLASPDEIHNWSHGEVTKPETINYRTQKPEKDGLFCEKIFGPSKDWECYCGKYKKIRYKGIVCDKCGVEVTTSLVRRERMGHIDLAVPVSHIWFLRGVPSKIGLVLDLSIQNLEKVIYFANFIITKVDENLKKETIEQLKQEFKSRKKNIENDFARKVQQLKNELSGKGKSEKDIDSALVKLNDEKERELKELDNDFSLADKELKELKPLKIVSENLYHELSLKYGHIFEAGIGAEAVRSLMDKIDVKKLIAEVEKEIVGSLGIKKEKLTRRLKLLRNLEINKIKPEWMILAAVPVIPPDLRPMVPLDGGRFATSDLNDLYRRVINRNNRLKRLIELNAPEVISRNEKRMLQEAVDALIDNSARHTKTTIASTGQKRQLKSIADILKGKQGRFRQNLLGKRIDYSGRSVIVVGPKLHLDQCGLPKRMALELFRPFIISHLIKDGHVHNIRSANHFIEMNRSEVWDILEDITKDAYVLLNRAPTLHRLGIQAFRPILIEGKAIQVHPLVCTAFNADFDGDQMAVHLPLTEEAKREAKELMLSSKNLLKPATGNPVVSPSKDMVWGIYYMTSYSEIEDEKIKIFSSFDEATLAYHLTKVKLRAKIKVRELIKGNKQPEIIETSVGRIIFNQIMPEKIPFLNKMVDSKELGEIVRLCLELYGREETANMLDSIKELGFRYITKSGYSWGMNDLPNIPEKQKIIEDGDTQIDEIQTQYDEGLLTSGERHSRIIEVWTKVKDDIVKLSRSSLDKTGTVFTMVESGARGSWAQLTQMVGMKGLVSNPAGEIIELPVKGNFKEGFNVLEYFISTHGSRKGLSDTALRTANAGYLTRRLVDVAQDVIIIQEDCGDKDGALVTQKESEEIGENIINRITGRVSLEKITDPKTGDVIVKKDELITEEKARKLKEINLTQIKIRSALTCKLRKGLCQKCYGYDLGYRKMVNIGTAVGIIAAQSIGEPGTQLTMRTFHTGGVASGADITRGLPRVEELFEGRPPKRKALMSDVEGFVQSIKNQTDTVMPDGKVMAAVRGQKVIKVDYKELQEEKYELKKDEAKIKAKDGAKIKKGDIIFTRDTENNGKKDAEEVKAKNTGEVAIEKGDDKIIIKITAEVEATKDFLVPPGYFIWVKEHDPIALGDQLTDGSLDLQQLFQYKGKGAVQKYIIKEIQTIYASQGQKLNDKHIEIIIRQLFSRVYVKESGDTNLLPGEIIEKAELEEANDEIIKKNGKLAEAEELFLGITRVSLSTRSFLSAASFQETSRVLINAAVTGKIDHLEGLKENVIIGRLIPAGTGYKPKS
jgi:DNA-directed RNA polymerase subunit beta'